MKKFAVSIAGVNGSCKRSLTMAQIEILFVVSDSHTFDKHRKFFNITFIIPGTDYNKAVTVKKLPNGYLPKFSMNIN